MYQDHLEFSKTRARKAAKKLVENKLSFEEKMKYLSIVANFRSAHSYPMQSMIGHIRNKSFEVDNKAVIVRRLKRIPSIIDKLKRFPNMQLSTMGDIGGIRIILKNIKQVRELEKSLKTSRTKNKLISEKDYLSLPKDSGYRGIHLTYSYQGSQQAYQDLRVELQIRSKIQHSWATAVEVAGTFSRQNYKASLGNKDWLEFFQLTSRAFASLEAKEAIADSLKKSMNEKIQTLKVFDVLASFTIVTKHSDKKDGFYLLQLDIERKKINAKHIKPSFLVEAVEDYQRIEQEISEDPTKDVVLVSAHSLRELRIAYPNYFADTIFFLANLKEALQSNTKKSYELS